MTSVPAGWVCGRYDCVDLRLPPHTHVMVPFAPGLVGNPYSATHRKSDDIDRLYVDWRAVAYEAWTGRQLPPPAGQLTLELEGRAGG